MTDLGSRLKQEMQRLEPLPLTEHDFFGRRDRKRRDQRIAAGVVGIAVFAAAVSIVWVGSLDRSRTDTGGTRPTPTEPGPVSEPDMVFSGIPPEGVEPRSPDDYGELVLSQDPEFLGAGIHVYADGSVIWLDESHILDMDPEAYRIGNGWRERRLSPEGLELVLSGDVLGGTRTSRSSPDLALAGRAMWEDATSRPYVPTRYSIFREGVPPRRILDLLHEVHSHGITIEEARSLDEALQGAGFELRDPPLGYLTYHMPRGATITLTPLMPNGESACCQG